MPVLAAAAFRAPFLRARPRSLSARHQPAQPSGSRLAAVAATAPAARRQLRCRAAGEKEPASGTQQTEGAPTVPDTPPAPTQQPTASSSSSSSSSPAEPTMSIEEIQRAAASMRQQKAAAAGGKESFYEGVSEEVRLIKWPAPLKAGLNTLLVIGIVAGTAATLLTMNSLLTQLSELIY